VIETTGRRTLQGWTTEEPRPRLRLIAPRSVRAFVSGDKTDAAARAIWTADQQPDARFVAVKTEAQ